MLLLVLADSYLLLYVGWEGVGLASYLLIGFWNYNPALRGRREEGVRRQPGRRLRAVDRDHDHVRHVRRGRLRRRCSARRGGAPARATLTAIGLMLLLAACGKSAQFPLQSWLGDAMAGPTPVSALIHAATMVTAGVYLIVRSRADLRRRADRPARRRHRRRDHAAVRGDRRLRQGRHQEGAGRLDDVPDRLHDAGRRPRPGRLRVRDLPPAHARLLQGRACSSAPARSCTAWTTRSTCAGSAGCRAVMKITWVTFWLGWLAIIGVPPFSGFWSKDKIIEAAFDRRGLAAVGVRRGRAARRRHHRVLHVPPVLHDVPRRAPLDRRRPPARVPAAHDGAADGAGGRLGLRSASCSARPARSTTGWAGGRAEPPRSDPVLPGARAHRS